MKDICTVLITVDRTSRGKENYLHQTLSNLRRGLVFSSPRLHSFHLVDSGSRQGWAKEIVSSLNLSSQITIHTPPTPSTRLACENVGTALIIGALSGAPWTLFCEDDIDVCADFLTSVGAWLDTHNKDPRYRLFAFGAAYAQVQNAYVDGLDSWEYPVGAFYGTQCFAIRSVDALSLGQYVQMNPIIKTVHNPDAYDLMFHDWANWRYPGCSFLASAPSFIEHIGRQSICTGKEETHRFLSWPGRGWTYKEPRQTMNVEVSV